MTDETPEHIRSLQPGFQPYAVWFINALRYAGIPAIVISSRRDPAKNREVGGAARSLHLTGQAIDIAFYPDWLTREQLNAIPWWWWEHLGRLWELAGGRWGGRFQPPDVNHFDSGPTWA